jgi:light-harvesting complex I chlorophyll a/b binding protein 1
MQNVAVVALALLESAAAFQAPALKASSKAVQATMFAEGDIGVTRPLGVYDPLGLIGKRDMRRYEVMEIKHGRAAMMGFLHVILIHAGARVPGYLSLSGGIKFSDIPDGCFASLEALPTAAWLQIMLVTCMMETGFFIFNGQDPAKDAGDIGGESWTRYDDKATKAFKLNVERNNGRAAMMGITGCLIHELLGVDALYPTGGMDGAAPPAIFG